MNDYIPTTDDWLEFQSYLDGELLADVDEANAELGSYELPNEVLEAIR